jgi:hypothetical protein
MSGWWQDGRKILAVVIAAATLVAAWMFRFEWADQAGAYHRNRFTGATCWHTEECWFSTDHNLEPVK